MIVGSSLTTGELMNLLTYCMNILMSLMMLSMIFVMVTMSTASAERICQVLGEEPDLTNPRKPRHTTSPTALWPSATWTLPTARTPTSRSCGTSISLSAPGRPSGSSAAPAAPKPVWWASSAACTT